MKKLLGIMMAVAMVAGLAVAESVYSQNVVGYVKVEAPAAGQFSIVALAQISPEGVNIQDAVSNMADLNAATVGNYAEADKLFVWDGAGYVEYGLFQPDEGDAYWMASGEPAWTLDFMAGVPADIDVERGQGVWFKTGDGQDPAVAIVAGEVPNDATSDVEVVQGFNLLSFPFSATINLQDLDVDNAAAATVGNYASADKLFVWDGAGYVEYGLFQPDEGDPYWMASGEPAWTLDFMAGVPADVDIDLGLGFWYAVPGEAKTIGFDQPYTLD